MFSSVLLFLNIGGPEMILIVFVALLLFGGEKLPEIARGLGKGIRDFKDASEGVKREINAQINAYEKKREEKKVEEAIIANQQAAQTHALTEGPVVENTMPMSDINFNVHTESETDSHETGYDVPEAENHNPVQHVDTQIPTNEHNKNS